MAVTLFNVTLGIPRDYYYAIGVVANKWALLEHSMADMIRQLLCLDNKSGRCLTGGMTARALSGTLKNLATLHITDAPLRDEIIAWEKLVLAEEERRNEFVHCVWGVPQRGGPLTLLIGRSAAQRLKPDGEPLTSDQVLEFGHRLHLLAVDGERLYGRLVAWQTEQRAASPTQTDTVGRSPAGSPEASPPQPPPSPE